MTELPYSLVVEATADSDFFAFYSPDLEGFTGVGGSVEDCCFKAQLAIQEHIALLAQLNLPIPKTSPNPTVTIQNLGQRL